MTGECRLCGCTDETPCVDDEGLPCAWANEQHTLCTGCVGERQGSLQDPVSGETFDVYSPGTYVAGVGWQPLSPIHRAALGQVVEDDVPELYLPFGSGLK